jgi:UDP-N-acetylglucosamine 4-epimerase
MNVGGGGRRTSILELHRLIGEAVGTVIPPQHVPARPGDVRDSLADTTKAQRILAWQPRTPLDAGIAETLSAPKE